MEEQIRRLSVHFGWNLSDDEVRRIAAEALVQEQVLERLKQVNLAQTRPIMGVFKSRRSTAKSRGTK
jgi:hypothetical protein